MRKVAWWLLAALIIATDALLAVPTPSCHCSRSSCQRHRMAPAILCVGGNSEEEEQVDDDDERPTEFMQLLAAERNKFEMDEEAILAIGSTYALLFNAGSGNEGIYSRRLPTSTEDTTGVDLVVAFEELDDAVRYTEMLAATDFPTASPSEVDTEALLSFCQEGGHVLGVVRSGTLIVPPEVSVEQFEWSPGKSEEAVDIEQHVTSDELEEQRGALEALLGMTPPDSSEDGNGG